MLAIVTSHQAERRNFTEGTSTSRRTPVLDTIVPLHRLSDPRSIAFGIVFQKDEPSCRDTQH
jgi:hypothetical protein